MYVPIVKLIGIILIQRGTAFVFTKMEELNYLKKEERKSEHKLKRRLEINQPEKIFI